MIPRKIKITINRPIFVKGKGMPKQGACLFRAGEVVEVELPYGSGNSAVLTTTYRGREIRVSTILSTL